MLVKQVIFFPHGSGVEMVLCDGCMGVEGTRAYLQTLTQKEYELIIIIIEKKENNFLLDMNKNKVSLNEFRIESVELDFFYRESKVKLVDRNNFQRMIYRKCIFTTAFAAALAFKKNLSITRVGPDMKFMDVGRIAGAKMLEKLPLLMVQLK